jgi:hypothetical protein
MVKRLCRIGSIHWKQRRTGQDDFAFFGAEDFVLHPIQQPGPQGRVNRGTLARATESRAFGTLEMWILVKVVP